MSRRNHLIGALSAALSIVGAARADDFIRGDVDGSGALSLHDASLIASHLAGSVALPCLDAADANDDGSVTSEDAAYIIAAHLEGGPNPAAPYPVSGMDPTPDGLDCADGAAIPPGDAADVTIDYEPSSRGQWAYYDIDVWVTSPRAVRAVEMAVSVDTEQVNFLRPVVADELLGTASVTSDASGDRIAVFFGTDREIPADVRTLAFTVEICIANPTPIAGWDLPIEFDSIAVSCDDQPGVAEVGPDGLVARIPFGLGDGPVPCSQSPKRPQHVTCETLEDGSVVLRWENPVAYDQISVGGGSTYEILPGDATSWVDPDGGADHNYIYSVAGGLLDAESSRPRWSWRSECAAPDPNGAVAFLRGDVNQDGAVSIADLVSFQRWLFGTGPEPGCRDATDVNDDGQVNILDVVAIPHFLFGTSEAVGLGTTLPSPFPSAGFDPTHAGESELADCRAYEVSRPVATQDAVRLGQVEAAPGELVEVPIYVSNSDPIEAIQLVVRYDSARLEVVTGQSAVSFEDSFFSPLIAQRTFFTERGFFTWDEPHVAQIEAFPDEGYLTLGIVGHIFYDDRFAIPPGEDTIVGRIPMRVSSDVSESAILTLTPEDGPDGTGFGPFALRNELAFNGEGRLATILPTTIEGMIAVGVDGDVSFFIRGDANGDRLVDVSDPVSTLAWLFLDGDEPTCADAADADDSGHIDISDPIATLAALFLGGATLPAPFPEPGLDLVPDFLPICANHD